jgi:hypothetical protein
MSRRHPPPLWTTSVFALLATLAAVPAFAQRTTGTIFGTVSDESGAVLPGVTVTLTSVAVPGTPTTITSEAGVYRFLSLPPGSYDLTFELQGFSTVSRQGTSVPLGMSVQIDEVMKVSGLAETVTVTGETPVVDVTSNQISTNYNREWVENAPVRRFTFFDLINAAPGVSANTSTSSASTSFGSGTTDNSYQLDGTDFTAPSTGQAWPWPNTDAIEEVQVLSLGATAEYGNLMGAVFNVVTRQGSNTFHGDANYYFQTQNLTSRNTTDDQDDGLPYNRDQFDDVTVQLGGPILRDKFWFFGSFQYQRDFESAAGTEPEFPARNEAKRVFFKLNYQLNDSNKIQFQYHDDFYRIPEVGAANVDPIALLVETGHNPSPGVVFTSVVSNKTVLEARYSGFYGDDHGDPLNGGPRAAPRYYALDTGAVSGGIYYFYDGSNWKTAFSGKATHYADAFLGGNHELKLGVQYNSGGSDYLRGYNDYIYTYGGEPQYGYTQLPFAEGGQMRALGIYADDTFRLGSRLTLNLGVRFDYSKAFFESQPVYDRFGQETGETTSAVDNVFDWTSVSPRFGFSLKLNDSGRSVLKGHYGRYYRGVVTGEFQGASPAVSPRFLFSGQYDEDGNPLDTELVSDNTNLRVDPDFRNPYTDQFIVGFEHAITTDLGVSVNYIHKRGQRPGGWQEVNGEYQRVDYLDVEGADASGQPISVFQLLTPVDERLFLLTNPDDMFSRYNGVDIQVVKRLADRWQATAGLTLSKAEGRLGSSLNEPDEGTGSTALTFGQNPNDFVNTDGRLTSDRPVVFKLQVVGELPWGITAAANFQHQTGKPWSRIARITEPDLGLPQTTILAEPLTGDRRLPDWNVVDLRVEKAFTFADDMSLAVFGDVLNLTNSDTYENIGNRLGTAENFGLPTRFIFPRRLMLGAKFRF